MAIYVISALLLPVYSKFIKSKKKLCIVISLHLFLIMAFRNNYLGVDLGGYENTYRDIQRFSLSDILSQFSFLQTIRVNSVTSEEFGYILSNWILGRLGFSYHTLLVLNAACIMTALGYFIYKYSDNPVISFIIFMSAGPWYYSFGLLRQTIATALILFAIDAIINKKNTTAIILMLIAVLFHRSSLVFFVLFILYKIRIKRLYYVMALIGCGVIAILGPFLVQKLIFPFLTYLGKTSYVKLMNYPISKLTIALWLLAIAFLFVINFDEMKDKVLNLMFWGFLLFLAIQVFSRYVSTITRFQTVFIIMTGILLANEISRCRVTNNKQILSVACFVFFFLYMCISLKGSAIDPYVSIFEYMPFPV